MAEPWSEEFSHRVRAWCEKIAILGADALVYAGLIPQEQFERATEILSEELFVRLCLHDYPPMLEPPDPAPEV